jgi:hypothetical protein
MKKLVIMSFLLMFLAGCASWQKTVISVAQMDATNAASTRIVAQEIARTWPLNSGALSVVLVKFKGLLPCDCDGDIKTLNTLSAKCVAKDSNGVLTCQELTDTDMGQIVTLWGWIWGSIGKSGVDKIMQTFFPAVLAKILPYVTALGL